MTPDRPRRNFLFKLRPVLRWIFRLRATPKAVAGGLALGTFIAFTPTYGIQLLLAVVCATMLNMNRAAAIVPVWITNPVTIAPVYTFTYWLGTFFVSGPPSGEVARVFFELGKSFARLDFWDIDVQLISIIQMGKEILIPLTIGSCVAGLITAVFVYFFSMKGLQFLAIRRSRRKKLN